MPFISGDAVLEHDLQLAGVLDAQAAADDEAQDRPGDDDQGRHHEVVGDDVAAGGTGRPSARSSAAAIGPEGGVRRLGRSRVRARAFPLSLSSGLRSGRERRRTRQALRRFQPPARAPRSTPGIAACRRCRITRRGQRALRGGYSCERLDRGNLRGSTQSHDDEDAPATTATGGSRKRAIITYAAAASIAYLVKNFTSPMAARPRPARTSPPTVPTSASIPALMPR